MSIKQIVLLIAGVAFVFIGVFLMQSQIESCKNELATYKENVIKKEEARNQVTAARIAAGLPLTAEDMGLGYARLGEYEGGVRKEAEISKKIEKIKTNYSIGIGGVAALFMGLIVFLGVSNKKTTKKSLEKTEVMGLKEKLARLDSLLADGTLTKEEHEYKRNEIIGNYSVV